MPPLRSIATVSFLAVAGTIAMLSLDIPDKAIQDGPSRVAHEARRLPTSRGSSDDAAIVQELRDLRRQLGEIRREQNAPLESSLKDSHPQEDTPHRDEDEADGTQISPEETAEGLSENFAAEEIDSEATSQAASHIGDHLSSEGFGRLADVGCGRTLCLALVDFNDEMARDAGLQQIGTMLPWDTDGFFISDPNNGQRVSVYFSREGHPLPSSDAT